MDAAQLREEVEKASRLVAEQAEWISTLEDGNSRGWCCSLSEAKARLGEERDNFQEQNFVIQALKSQLRECWREGEATDLDAEGLLRLSLSAGFSQPPWSVLEVIEKFVRRQVHRPRKRQRERPQHGPLCLRTTTLGTY